MVGDSLFFTVNIVRKCFLFEINLHTDSCSFLVPLLSISFWSFRAPFLPIICREAVNVLPLTHICRCCYGPSMCQPNKNIEITINISKLSIKLTTIFHVIKRIKVKISYGKRMTEVLKRQGSLVFSVLNLFRFFEAVKSEHYLFILSF